MESLGAFEDYAKKGRRNPTHLLYNFSPRNMKLLKLQCRGSRSIPGTVLSIVSHIKPMEYQHFYFRHDPVQWRESRVHPRLGFAYKTNEILEFCFLTWPIVLHPG